MSLVVNTKINPGFDNLNAAQDYTFLTGVINGKEYCHFAYSYAGEMGVVHFFFKDFKLSTLKEALSDWEKIKHSFKYHGIKKIITMNNEGSGPKWERFLNMFGFGQPETIRISSLEM